MALIPTALRPRVGLAEHVDDLDLPREYQLGEVLFESEKTIVRDLRIETSRRPCVIKIALTDEAVRRLDRESELCERLSGRPNFATYVAEGEGWLVTEKLQGEDLAGRLKRRGAMIWAECFPILEQLCDVAMELHSKGITHQRLRTSNLKNASGGK